LSVYPPPARQPHRHRQPQHVADSETEHGAGFMG
jgi:hypothetical protein